MEQSLTDRVNGEELVNTRVGGVHSMDKDLRPPNYASSVTYVHWSADYEVKL